MLRITRTFMARLFLYDYYYWNLQYSIVASKHNDFRMMPKTDLKLFLMGKMKNARDINTS